MATERLRLGGGTLKAREVEVTYREIDAIYAGTEKAYEVLLDGDVIGTVESYHPTRERSGPRGATYVSKRWTSKSFEWEARRASDGRRERNFSSRMRAVAFLLDYGYAKRVKA